MLKLIGFISREMYHTQNLIMRAPDLMQYKIPLDSITSLDINRKVMFDTEKNEVVFETLKEKGMRMQNLFIIEKEENKPIISIDMDTAKED